MGKQADLIAYLFAGQGHSAPLSGELLRWMDASTRFTDFVDTYRDKIRKKIRVSPDAEGLLDLRSELLVASCLLNDRRLAVVYEPYARARGRGPDFSVTFRSNRVFNIEVARMRVEENSPAAARLDEKILRILLYKLGQMQPGAPNLLAIHTRASTAQGVDLSNLMQGLKTRVESKDPAFYAAARYSSPAAFYKDFLHLSGILLWTSPPLLWANKQARPPLEEKILRLVSSLAALAN